MNSRRKRVNSELKSLPHWEWIRTGLYKCNARNGLQRARRLNAAPLWANAFFLEEAYDLASLRSEAFGFEWQVDHQVPLKHPLVQGLHVETNVRVVPWWENMSKGNRRWPDMWATE